MLLGTHQPRLDEKGRMVLPSKFRQEFADGVVMTKGQDRCVVLWPSAEFSKYSERLNEASRSNAAVRSYLRVLFSSAFDQSLDKQGRVSVPAALRDFASLDRDVVITGNGSTAEVWNGPAWQDYVSGQEASFSDLAEEVVPGLF
ncbi:MAG: division/cell wall cluster transcriptional repressor MraZ [Candidatus Nanopelagicales bacterium]|nr:division/cell wall cluster transcriptional repressor MraZ [Candidatus Nanopelagicales bacterium]MDZ4248526.1 division/cell wall cluster transcriptional repressor MraZ [Candidatus Nanopelagicales bacterium]MDZ7577902.1 division/cell wall cluster transcriptional repressor MraZ [Candidatus Nanopelagicales bacterium]